MLAKINKAARLIRRPVWRRGLLYGVAATIEHHALQSLITPQTVIDIGANKGQFTLFALEAWPKCKIYAFEPLAVPAQRYRRVTSAYSNVTLFQAAIGPISCEADLHLSEREDSSSLLPMHQRMQVLFPEARSANRTERVRVAPLAEFLDGCGSLASPVLLKLDVQGYELEALKGCEKYLPEVNYVYVECSYVELYKGQPLINDVIRYLDGQGFHLQKQINLISSACYGDIQADCLFIRRNGLLQTV